MNGNKEPTTHDLVAEIHEDVKGIKKVLNGDPQDRKDTGLCGTVIGLTDKVEDHSRVFRLLAGGAVTIAAGLVVWIVRTV